MTSTPTLTVGLTGGIASGKSTVGQIMAELGCFVTDADRLVSELYRPKGAGAEAVASSFGAQYLDAKGAVDKEQLSKLVFSDVDARRKLERLIHPLVSRRFAEQTRKRGGIVVFEATLLVDGGGYRNFDRLLTVEADPELRLKRAVERGLSLKEAQARLQAQTTEGARIAVANHVIRNEGTLEQLRDATEEVVAKLKAALP